MTPFKHPLFSKFRARFEDLLRDEVRATSDNRTASEDRLIGTYSVDSLINAVNAVNPKAVGRLLNATLANTLGTRLPYNMLGDAIYSFGSFVLKNGRQPGCEHLLFDVLYHMKTSGELSTPLRVFVSDKEFGKIYISGLVGSEFVIPTFAILSSEADVNSYTFPPHCAVKPTNQSGSVILASDHGRIDTAAINSWFGKNLYFLTREANYKPLSSKVIVEELLIGFYEVKVFCILGVPRIVQISRKDSRSPTGRTTDFFSRDFIHLPVTSLRTPNSTDALRPPRLLKDILCLSEELSRRFNFIRVDFYTNDKTIKVGELTSCDRAGRGRYRERNAEKVLSDCLFRS